MSDLLNSTAIARLTVQRAMLGQVSSKVRAVVLTVSERSLCIRFYYDGEISEADLEAASCVETEVLADYSSDDLVTTECIRLDAPQLINDDGVWVYHRQELA